MNTERTWACHCLIASFSLWWELLSCGEGSGTPLQYSCLENPWTEEPGGLQSMGSLRVGHDWVTSLSLFTFMHWRRKWQPTPVFLPGETRGQEPDGLPSMGSHRIGHDWSDLAAAAAAAYSRVCYQNSVEKRLEICGVYFQKYLKEKVNK